MATKKKKITKSENVGIKEAIERAGGQSALARLCKVTQPAVYHWLHVRCTPEQAIKIEHLTGVSRVLMCPEIFA